MPTIPIVPPARFAECWKRDHLRLVHAMAGRYGLKKRLPSGLRVVAAMVAAKKAVVLLATVFLKSTALLWHRIRLRCRRHRRRRPRWAHSSAGPATTGEEEDAATAASRKIRKSRMTSTTAPRPSRSGIALRPPSRGSPAPACLAVERVLQVQR